MRKHLTIATLLLASTLGVLWAYAQTKPTTEPTDFAKAPATAPSTGPALLSGDRFIDSSAGIAFNPPTELEQVKRPGPVEQIVTFVSEKKKAALIVTRVICKRATPIATSDKAQMSMLELYAPQLSAPPISARILRQDVVNAGKSGNVPVGMLAARFTSGPMHFLRQQAIVQADRTQCTYFVLEYTVPTVRRKDDVDDDNVDANEKVAVDTFRDLIDTIELYDTRDITREIENRLFCTRTLLVNLTNPKKMQAALIPERVMLIVQQGQEVGYSYIEEKWDSRDNQEGIVVSMRTRSEDRTNKLKIEAVADMFSIPDRRYESWATVTNTLFVDRPAPNNLDQTREVGMAVRQTSRHYDEEHGQILNPKDKDDKKQPPVRIEERHHLTVTQLSKSTNRQPVERDLPPYYMTQALSEILPRLLPLQEPKGYAFAIWVGSEREVIRRYLDVMPETRVNLRGQSLLVIPVKDRIGYEGLPTFHYFSREGKYLASVNEAAHTALYVSNAETVKKLFPEADLTAPQIRRESEK